MNEELVKYFLSLFDKVTEYAKERNFNIEFNIESIENTTDEFGSKITVKGISVKSLSKKPYAQQPIDLGDLNVEFSKVTTNKKPNS